MKVESLAIGDELLDGRILDTNTRSLADALSVVGMELQRAGTVPDARATLVQAIQEAAARADVVVTSGGLGPTSDDITAECVAEAASTGLRFDEPSFARMEAMFAMRGMPMPESNRRQAMLPASSRALENAMGTAPGFVTPLSVGGRSCQIWSSPGVPREYEHLLETYLLPEVRRHLDEGAPRFLVRRTLRTLGMAESAVFERLQSLEKDNPDLRVQYRVFFPEILVRLVLSGTREQAGAVDARADGLLAQAMAAIGPAAWGNGDESLEERVLKTLSEKKATLALAESCTGGLIAKRLTDVPGSSDVVVGGVVSYANDVKVALLGVGAEALAVHGAVSEEVARAMAEGARVRLGATWGVSTTGVAGPGGGSADKPVGTVWFGLSGPTGTHAMKKKFPDFGRSRIRELAAATALRWLLDESSREAPR